MASPVITAISLCAGVGMLDVGAGLAFGHLGIAWRTVAYAEWEAPAASQLVALMEAGALEPAPVWCGDFRRAGLGRFRGTVDCIAAGFPCQDISIAGRRAGLDGKRSGLFFDILDIADDCGAWLLALENVSAIATATASVVDEEEGELDERAAARVVGELADRGWDAEWITLSASDVGASHGRARWFCFAWRRDMADAGRGLARRIEQEPVGRRSGAAEYQPCHEAVDDPARHGHDGPHRQAGLGRGVCEAGDSMGDTENDHGRRGICATQEGAGPGRVGRRGSASTSGALAVAQGDGRNEGRAEPGREQGRPDAAECGCAVADTSSAGLPQRVSGGGAL